MTASVLWSRAARKMRRSAIPKFVLGRVVVGAVLVLGATLITFILTNLVPGNPALAALGESAADNPAAIAAFNQQHHINDSLPQRYWFFLSNLIRGNLGISQRTGNPVRQDLADFIPATLELALVSIIFAVVVGVVFGTVAAMFRDRLPDKVIRAVSLGGVSMPGFWLALVALYWLSFRIPIFTGTGRLDPTLDPPAHVTGLYTIDSLVAGDWAVFGNAVRHLLLPALVLAAYNVGMLTRFTRAAVIQVIEQDYIRTARAKGLRAHKVVVFHILRAALVPVVNLVGLMFGAALSGSILVEKIFSWPGLGQYAFNSSTSLDLPAIAGVALFVAVAYVTINIVVDVLAGVIDPRIGLSGGR